MFEGLFNTNGQSGQATPAPSVNTSKSGDVFSGLFAKPSANPTAPAATPAPETTTPAVTETPAQTAPTGTDMFSGLNLSGSSQPSTQTTPAQNTPPQNIPAIPTDTPVKSDNLINTVVNYAKALGIDPVKTFDYLFTGQKITEIKNGTIIVQRMPLAASSAVKTAQGGNNPSMKLDHTIPLEMGGDNSPGNLKLVPTATWASYTPYENLLGNAVASKTIDTAQAQSWIQDFKSGKLTGQQIQDNVNEARSVQLGLNKGQTYLSQAPTQSLWQKAGDWLSTTFGLKPDVATQQALDMNALAVKNNPQLFPTAKNYSLDQLSQPGGNVAHNSPMEQVIEDSTGKQIGTASEAVGSLTTLALASSLLEISPAILAGLGITAAVAEIKSNAIALATGKGMSLIPGHTLSELAPNAEPGVKNILDVIDLVGTMFASGLAIKGALSNTPATASYEVTPQDAQKMVIERGMADTPEGQGIINQAQQATEQGKNIQIDINGEKNNPIAKTVGIKSPTQGTVTVSLVDPSPELSGGATDIQPVGEDIPVNTSGGEKQVIPANATMITDSSLTKIFQDVPESQRATAVQNFLTKNNIDVVKTPATTPGAVDQYKVINPKVLTYSPQIPAQTPPLSPTGEVTPVEAQAGLYDVPIEKSPAMKDVDFVKAEQSLKRFKTNEPIGDFTGYMTTDGTKVKVLQQEKAHKEIFKEAGIPGFFEQIYNRYGGIRVAQSTNATNIQIGRTPSSGQIKELLSISDKKPVIFDFYRNDKLIKSSPSTGVSKGEFIKQVKDTYNVAQQPLSVQPPSSVPQGGSEIQFNNKGFEVNMAKKLQENITKADTKFGDNSHIDLIGKNPDSLPPDQRPNVEVVEDHRLDKTKPGTDIVGEVIGNRYRNGNVVVYTVDTPPTGVGEVKPQITAQTPPLSPTGEVSATEPQNGVSPTVKQTEIVQPVAQLKQVYAENRQSVEEALSQIWQEMDVAAPGERNFTRNPNSSEATITGTPSTFPKWVSPEFRSRALFDKVMTPLADMIDNPSYPPANKPKLRALFDEIASEIDSRAGINTSKIRSDIMNGSVNQNNQSSIQRSPQRSEASIIKNFQNRQPQTTGNERPASNQGIGNGVTGVNGNESNRTARNGGSVVPPVLENLATNALLSKDMPTFVSDEIFSTSLSGEEKAALDKFPGVTTSDKLEAFYNEVNKTPSGSVTLHSEIIPGISKFFEEDVIPTATTAKEGIKQVYDVLNPPRVSKGANEASNIVRQAMAKIENYESITGAKYKSFRNFFSKYSDEANVSNISNYERTGHFAAEPPVKAGDPAYSQLYHDSMVESYKILRAAYGKDEEGFIENYVRRPFQFANTEEELKGIKALTNFSRSLSGSKSPLKQRVLDMPLSEAFQDMQDRGIKVKMTTTNPEELRQWSLVNAKKAIVYKQAWNDLRESKLIQFVNTGGDIPDGMVKLEDRVAQVFYPPFVEVKEAFDARVMDDLNKVAEGLGIVHERNVNIGGKRWGYTSPGSDKVVTKFGGPESVLAHEIGHQIDYKYGLQDMLVNNPETKIELRNLADLQFGGNKENATPAFQRYVRKGPEKMAVILESYIHTPELLKKTAPNTYRIFNNLIKSDPKLAPLSKIRNSLELGVGQNKIGLGGPVLGGNYYADSGVARILNNAISSGLEDIKLFKSARVISNLMNQFQLGFSAFHLTGSALNSSFSDMALGLRNYIQGKPIEGTVKVLRSIVPGASFVKDIYHGQQFMNNLMKDDPEAQAYLDKFLNPAGGRLALDRRYNEDMASKLKTTIANGNYIGAILRLPAFLTETVSKPLLQYAIPRVKIGAFMDLAANTMQRLPEDATPEQVNSALSRAWNSIDNRFGQLVYNNLFWNKTGKDIAMLTTRSVGWNLGDIRELGGGILKDPINTMILGKERINNNAGERFSDRMLFSISLILGTTILAAIYEFLHTGHGPQELKDYFFPEDGGVDTAGNPTRRSLPTYWRDTYAFGTNPMGTIGNKMSPGLATLLELWQNKDYYGNLIRNPNDPTGTQLSQAGAFMLSNIMPFSIQNAAQGKQTTEQQIEGFLGITKAPASIVQSTKQQSAIKAYQNQVGLPGPKTPEQVATQNLKTQAYAEIKTMGTKSPAYQTLIKNGTLNTALKQKDFLKAAKLNSVQRMIQHLSKTVKAGISKIQ